MEVLVFLIPASLGLGALGLLAFLWSLRNRQYEDPKGDAGYTEDVDALFDLCHGCVFLRVGGGQSRCRVPRRVIRSDRMRMYSRSTGRPPSRWVRRS